MVEIEYNKIVEEKCGIALRIKTEKIKILTKQLNNTNDPAKIMIICDKITDEIAGFNTDGFRFK